MDIITKLRNFLDEHEISWEDLKDLLLLLIGLRLEFIEMLQESQD